MKEKKKEWISEIAASLQKEANFAVSSFVYILVYVPAEPQIMQIKMFFMCFLVKKSAPEYLSLLWSEIISDCVSSGQCENVCTLVLAAYSVKHHYIPLFFATKFQESLKELTTKRFKNQIQTILLQTYTKKCICTYPLCIDRRLHLALFSIILCIYQFPSWYSRCRLDLEI